ncbi:MAG: DUF2848 family protein [Parvibaculaceae bacterium]
MALTFLTGAGASIAPAIDRLILAGFAGRSLEEVEAHVAEMALQGVPRPKRFPMLWPVLPHLLTQSNSIAVYGPDTTPEVEYVLFTWQGVPYVTLGNDQCDIDVEARLSAEKSKNLCPKVLARAAWRLVDVLGHWDELRLTLAVNGALMQQDRLAVLIRPDVLREKVIAVDGARDDGRMIFSGTIATQGKLPPPPYDVTMLLTDERLGREIRHDVQVTALLPFE